MGFASRSIALLAALIVMLAGAIFGAAEVHRTSADRSAARAAAAQSLITAQLDLETGLRGFLQFGDPDFLEPYKQGSTELAAAVADARAAAGDDSALLASIDRHATLSERWRRSAEVAISGRRAGEMSSLAAALGRKKMVDQFRAENAELQALVEDRRRSSASHAGLILVALVLGMSAIFAAAGYLGILRPGRERGRAAKGAAEYAGRRDEFATTLQSIDDESGAHGLLKRHIERDVAECQVIVINRNNSNNRLEAVTEVTDDPTLAAKLAEAAPRSCQAIRLGREHSEEADREPLLPCEICGHEGASTCVPTVVGGEVIGSVLVRSDEPLGETRRERVRETVAYASPVIANLRSLAIAETRASTDALTGLANKRSCDETMKRMIAQSSRRLSSLAALAIDLDHFKQINDRFGHGAGDDVLAAVGTVITDGLRGSDFAGRPGGEEFLVLLPDTDLAGAQAVAENLRSAVEAIRLVAVDAPITASIGVATHPGDAGDTEGLMRAADRALYAAKAAGRNRVEIASSAKSPLAPIQ